MPLLLVLLSIVGYFAWQLYTASQLQRAAQRAARFAAIPTTDGTYAYRQCDVVDAVNDHLTSTTVESANVTVTDATATLTATACPNDDAATRPRGFVKVRVTRVLDNPFSDFLNVFFGGPGPMTISGSGEARVEDPS